MRHETCGLSIRNEAEKITNCKDGKDLLRISLYIIKSPKKDNVKINNKIWKKRGLIGFSLAKEERKITVQWKFGSAMHFFNAVHDSGV